MRKITTAGIVEDALYARRALEHAEKLKQEKQEEKAEKAKKKQLTFKEKEKRKRNVGMQSSGARPLLVKRVHMDTWKVT
jgi:hypothetical protein